MPAWMIPLLYAAAAGASTTGSAISARNANRSQQQMTREQLDAEIAMRSRDTALEESKLNPFRQQMYQGASISGLDELERGSYTPAKLDVSGSPYASYVPKVSGGYSYQKSPELIASAAALKKSVMAGDRAPSVTPDWVKTNAPVPGNPNMTQSLPPANNQMSILDIISMLYPDDPIAQQRRPTKPGIPPAAPGQRQAPANGPASYSLDTFTNRLTRR